MAQRRPTLFGGLLKCGACGGSYTTYTSGKLVCAKHRESKACGNGRTPKRIDVEARVLQILQEQITSPEATAAYVRTYQQAAADRRAQAAAQRAPLAKRLADLTSQIERAVNAIVRGDVLQHAGGEATCSRKGEGRNRGPPRSRARA